MEYSQAGSYTAIAGVIAMVISHFGLSVGQDSIVAVIAGAVALYGIIKQFIAHKKLAVSTGTISK